MKPILYAATFAALAVLSAVIRQGPKRVLKPLTTPAAIAVIKAKKAWSRADRP